MPIEAVHLVNEGAYLVELPYGRSFEVGGMPIKVRSVVVQSLSELVEVTRTHSTPASYKNESGSVVISAADYTMRRAELLRDSYLDDGARVFPSLDAEFAFRRFEREWVVHEITPAVETRAAVTDVQVVEVRTDSGDPDIVSLWNSPMMRVDRKLYTLDIDRVMVAAAQSLCADSGLTFYNDLAHSAHLCFAKIEGEYAFDDSFNQSSRPFIGTRAQCQQKKADCIERVRLIVAAKAAKKNGVNLANAGHIAERLANVGRTLSRVTSKAHTQAALHSARQDVNSLLHDIQMSLGAN